MSSYQKVGVSNRSVGFCGLLFIVLLLLKVGVVETAVVGWSWWLVTSPLWAPTCLVFGILSVILLVMLIIFLCGFAALEISDLNKKRKVRKTEKK